MVYRKNDGEIGALDYREKAPLAATKDMYFRQRRKYYQRQKYLWRNCCRSSWNYSWSVFKAQEKFGVLSVKEILTPVIALAKKGVVVTKKQEKRINRFKKAFEKVNKNRIIFQRDWKEGDTDKI